MSKEQLTHIFEPTACLTPRQMKGYITGKMVHEEAHAVEVHLLSCPFCSEAIEGLKEGGDAALSAIEKPDASFIAKHFGVSAKELNIGASKAVPEKGSSFKTFTEKGAGAAGGGNVRKLMKPVGIAAGLIAVVCIMWFMRDTIFPSDSENKQLAQQTPATTPEPQEREIAFRPEDTAAEVAMADTPATAPLTEEPEEEKKQLALVDTPNKKMPVKEEPKKDKEALLAAKKEAEQKAAEKKKQAEKLAANSKEKAQATVAKNDTKKEEDAYGLTGPKMPARMGNSYESASAASANLASDEVTETKAAAPPPKKKIELGTARSGILKGDEAFNEGKYKKALRQYQKVMYDPQSNQKDAATLMAAKCHIAEDEVMQARTLLNSLIKDNSTKKGEAAGLLKQLPKEE